MSTPTTYQYRWLNMQRSFLCSETLWDKLLANTHIASGSSFPLQKRKSLFRSVNTSENSIQISIFKGKSSRLRSESYIKQLKSLHLLYYKANSLKPKIPKPVNGYASIAFLFIQMACYIWFASAWKQKQPANQIKHSKERLTRETRQSKLGDLLSHA